MERFGLMAKVIAVVMGVTLAIAALASASAPQAPPHCQVASRSAEMG